MKGSIPVDDGHFIMNSDHCMQVKDALQAKERKGRGHSEHPIVQLETALALQYHT